MNFIKTYSERIITQDVVNKFEIKKKAVLPKLKKITLNFECKNFPIQNLATVSLALETISLKKSTLTRAKKQNISLKIQKGHPAGCKVELRKNEIYLFITRLNLEIIPKLKNLSGFKIEKQVYNFFFQLPGSDIILKEFENHYPLFANLPMLDVNMRTNSKKNKEVSFLAKSIKLPLIKKHISERTSG